MYILNNGDTVTCEQIEQAFSAGDARLVHSHGENKTLTSLALDGEDVDTHGECHSMWDECWTTTPTSLERCLRAARTN